MQRKPFEPPAASHDAREAARPEAATSQPYTPPSPTEVLVDDLDERLRAARQWEPRQVRT